MLDEKSLHLINKFDFFVFDFDQTILKIHAWALRVTPELANILNFSDPSFFKEFIQCLEMKHKKYAVVSLGDKNVILAHLNLLLKGYFNEHNVITPSQTESVQDKSQMLTDLLRKYDVSPRCTAFFDDSLPQIEAGLRLGINSYYVPPALGGTEGGFTSKYISALVNDRGIILGLRWRLDLDQYSYYYVDTHCNTSNREFPSHYHLAENYWRAK